MKGNDDLDEPRGDLGAQALLAALAEDPSLRGLMDVLGLAVDDVLKGNDVPGDLGDVFHRVAAVAKDRAAGGRMELSWQELLSGEESKPADLRRFIQVKPIVDWSSLSPASKAMTAIRRMAKELGLDPANGVRVRLTGGAALSTEELSSVFKGAKKALLISLVLVAFLLLYGLRSLRLVIAALATLVMGLIWTAGFAALAIGHLNLISVAFAVLFIGLGVDFGIHFTLRYREEVSRGAAHDEALRRTSAGVGGALALCAVAAAIGFFAFVPTAYLGLAELGLISGASMFIALAFNLTVLPALLTLMPLKPGIRVLHGVHTAPEKVIRRHGGVIAAVALMLGLGAMALAPQIRFDANPMRLKDPTTESVQTALDLMADKDTTPSSISVLVEDADAAAELSERLEALDVVGRVVTVNDFQPPRQDDKLDVIKEIGFVMLPVFQDAGRKPPPAAGENGAALAAFQKKLEELLAWSGTPSEIADGAHELDRALAAYGDGGAASKSIASLDRGLMSLLAGRLERLRQSLEAQTFRLSDVPVDIRGRYVATDGRLRVRISPRNNVQMEGEMERFVAAVTAVAPTATDTPVIVLAAADAIIDAIEQAALTAFVLISILLLALLRSLRDSLLVFFPLTLAGLLTVATAVLLDLPFNFANVIVLPLLMGLGVASGIHLVMRAREEEETGVGLLGTSTPRAVVFSALTTIGSFGSLAISTHRGTASMGELLTIAIGYTLVCTLVALPALMAWLERRRTGSTWTDSTG